MSLLTGDGRLDVLVLRLVLLGRHGPHQRPHAGLGDPLALARARGHLGVVLGGAGAQPVPVMVTLLGDQTLGHTAPVCKIELEKISVED